MKKKITLVILIVVITVVHSFAQKTAEVTDENLSKTREVKNSLIKAGIGDYDVYEPLDIYHSVPWQNEQENFLISEYRNAGDMDGDGINDMYYFAGNCGDERTTSVFDVIPKTIIIFGGADMSNLDHQIIYAEIIPLGDLNGDDYSDAVGINNDDSWQYYFGSATGLVANTTINITPFPDIICKFFDIDNDGYDDYITDSEISEFEIIYGNTSPDVFTTMTYNPSDFHITNNCAVGDIDGTGNKIVSFYTSSGGYDYEMHLIVCNPSDRTLSLLESKVTTRPNTIDIADIDGDGFKEIIYTTSYTDPANFKFKTYVLGKNASYPVSFYTDTVRLYDTQIYYVGDLNKDNNADFYICDEVNSSYHIAFGKTNYQDGLTKDFDIDFSDMESGSYESVYNYPEVLKDINGDGIDDFCFLVSNTEYFGHRFFLGNISTLTTEDILYDEVTYSGNTLFQTKNLGDINGDGNEDLAFVSYSGFSIKIYTNGAFDVPEFELIASETEQLQLVVKGDFNGDGYSDIAVYVSAIETYANTRIDFYYGSASFDITPDHTINFVNDLSINFTTYPDGFGVKYLGDINDDNIDDFMLYGDSKVFIFYGNSSLSTTPDHTCLGPNNFGARTTAPGDMNGDGIDDFAMSGVNNGGVNVYFGKGGTASSDAYSTPDLFLVADESKGYNYCFGFNLTSGDFNGDGLMDIAAMPQAFREISYASGDGIEGLYIFFGGENMDSIPDQLLKIPADPFAIDIAEYVNQFAGELTCLPDMNGDNCDELYMSGGWFISSPDNSASQKMQNGIIFFGGDFLVEDSIPVIQTYSTSTYNGAKNSFYYTDAHSAFGDFDRDGKNELLSTHENLNFLGTSVYKYSIDSLNHKPSSITMRHGTINENNDIGVVVDTIDVVDEEGNNNHTITFAVGEGYDNTDFTLEDNILKTNVIFNFEEKASYKLLIQAEDQGDLTKTMALTLNVLNINEAPEILKNIPDQITREDEAYSYTIPDTIFNDPDAGDVLTYSATLTDGSDVPLWFSIVGATGVISGTPADMDLKSIRIIAEDLEGLLVYDDFMLIVEGYDEVTEEEIVVDTTSSDDVVTVTVPKEVFTNLGLGDDITYTASLADGSPLPSYISFNPATLTFTITISNNKSYKEIMNELDIIITGVDSEGYTATVGFTLEGEFLSNNLDIFVNLKLYPNPVKDKLIIEMPDNNFGSKKIEIYSLTGCMIAKYQIESERIEIDLSSFDASIYILNIVGEKDSKAYRIIKQ